MSGEDRERDNREARDREREQRDRQDSQRREREQEQQQRERAERDREDSRSFSRGDWNDPGRRIERLEARVGNMEQPLWAAVNEIRAWQAAATEREKRREDAHASLYQRVLDLERSLREELRGIRESMPNKATTELASKAVFALFALIAISVISAGIAFLGFRR